MPGTAPAIFFHSDAVETEGKDLVGRRSAGESFLRGWLAHAPGDEVRVVAQSDGSIKALKRHIEALGVDRPLKAWVTARDDFTEAGTVFCPVPGFMGATWLRQAYGAERCSLVGITHTVSTRRVIEGLHNLLAEPVEAWDAIICTSPRRAVRG